MGGGVDTAQSVLLLPPTPTVPLKGGGSESGSLLRHPARTILA